MTLSTLLYKSLLNPSINNICTETVAEQIEIRIVPFHIKITVVKEHDYLFFD